jgi:Flp pilus assembly protein TadG
MADKHGILKSFARDTRGNIALLFGLSLVPMVGAASVAVDYSTASGVKTVIQAEVDAAALEAVKAAVDVQTDPAHASKSAAQRQTIIDERIATILSSRTLIARDRISAANTNLVYSGQWADPLMTEYRVTASVDVKRMARVLSSKTVTPVGASATARMRFDAVMKSSKPEMLRPGFNAGDYNRLYAYCYNKNETDPTKRRTQMTAVTSNGSTSSGMEVDRADIFKNVEMPECDVDKGETLSWRLQNVRDQRTNSARWPKDVKGTLTATYYENGAVKWHTVYTDGVVSTVTTGGTATGPVKSTKTKQVWRSDEPTGVNGTSTNPKVRQLYNHFSDTIVDANTGLETFSFRGDQMGYAAPINIMETVVCSTKELCNPDKPGSLVPKGDNRTPTPASTKCEPGKFMFIGFEDRPYVPGRPAAEYSTWGSGYWTDRDYEDVTFVISCPSVQITGYTQAISLIK